MAVKHTVKTGKMLSTSTGYVPETREVETTPIKAIRLMCLECMGHQILHIEGCTATTCPLFPYRMGDAHQKSPEERASMAERAKKTDFGRREVVG